MINFLKAIADNTNMEESRKSDLYDIFSHISAINSMRDFIVHHVDGSRQEFELENPRERVLTDSRRVSRTKNTKRIDVGSRSLIAMRDDIFECCWRLHSHWDHANEPFKPGAGARGFGAHGSSSHPNLSTTRQRICDGVHIFGVRAVGCAEQSEAHRPRKMQPPYRDGCRYQKAGVVLSKLVSVNHRQADLIGSIITESKSSQLMDVMDQINVRMDKSAAETGIRRLPAAIWKMKQGN